MSDMHRVGLGTMNMLIAALCAVSACSGPAPEQNAPAPLPLAETGFVDVPPQRAGAASVPARMFYSFRAADQAPERSPLLVVFNGGPGSATSAGLLANGTGPRRIKGGEGTAAEVVPNPGSLTRFANVLWIDERQAGFSYATEVRSGGCTFDPLSDAADFLRVMLAFIEAHPALALTRVGIVAESYGGVRANAMVHELVHAGEALGEELQLKESVTRWLGGPPTADRVAARMVGVVFIQALVLGEMQLRAQDSERPEIRLSHPDADPYDVRRPRPAPLQSTFEIAAQAFADRTKAALLFGVDVFATRGLAPPDRSHARRAVGENEHDGAREPNAALTAALGPLAAGDRYYDLYADDCRVGSFDNVGASSFLETLRTVPVFMTDAKYDGVIRTPAVFDLLAERGFTVGDGVPAGGAPQGSAGSGYRSVALLATATEAARTVMIRVAKYDAGHCVPETQAEAFSTDVGAWLASTAKARVL